MTFRVVCNEKIWEHKLKSNENILEVEQSIQFGDRENFSHVSLTNCFCVVMRRKTKGILACGAACKKERGTILGCSDCF